MLLYHSLDPTNWVLIERLTRRRGKWKHTLLRPTKRSNIIQVATFSEWDYLPLSSTITWTICPFLRPRRAASKKVKSYNTPSHGWTTWSVQVAAISITHQLEDASRFTCLQEVFKWLLIYYGICWDNWIKIKGPTSLLQLLHNFLLRRFPWFQKCWINQKNQRIENIRLLLIAS